MSKSKFKVGDRVRVYTQMSSNSTSSLLRADCCVIAIYNDAFMDVEIKKGLNRTGLEGLRISVFHQQCRRLVKKKARYFVVVKNPDDGKLFAQSPSGWYSDIPVGHWLKDCGTTKPKGA